MQGRYLGLEDDNLVPTFIDSNNYPNVPLVNLLISISGACLLIKHLLYARRNNIFTDLI